MNPLPLTVAAEMVRGDPPEFDSVSACVWLLPTGTLPRLMLEGALRKPGVDVLSPFPESATVLLPE